MIGTIIFFLALIILFVIMILYKLMDYNWQYQLMTKNFTDKDIFTRLVKFLMS